MPTLPMRRVNLLSGILKMKPLQTRAEQRNCQGYLNAYLQGYAEA